MTRAAAVNTCCTTTTPAQQYLAILTSRNSDPLALNFGHMRCWCQDVNCCINFGHFKLKVVILMRLEVAQSKVVISNTNHFIHWTRQPPISSPRSLLAQSNSGSVQKWCPLQTKSGQARKKTGLFSVCSFTSQVCKKLVLSYPPRTISNISASGRNQQKEYGTEREGASRGSCQNTNEILN